MDLRYSEDEERFRAEVRGWLQEALPTLPPKPKPEDWRARRSYDTAWQRMLHEAGYAGIDWPREFGGRGATPTEHLIFLEETERAGAGLCRIYDKWSATHGDNCIGLVGLPPYDLTAVCLDELKG